MRLALIGCGAIARRAHLPAFKKIDGVDVVAFASRSRSSAEAAAADWGSGQVVDGWEAALDVEGVDAVDICAPNAFHAPVAVAALRRGLHVLVEKPMATTVEEADVMIGAANAAGVVLMPAQNVRFAAPFVAAHDAVQAGRIGTVVAARAAFGHGGPQDWAPDAAWFFDPEQAGGGALLDLGVHMLDVLRHVVADEVVEVGAMIDMANDDAGVDRAAQVLLRFGRGAIATLHSSWRARPGPDHQLTIFGTEGKLHLDSRTPLTFSPASGKPEPVDMPSSADSPFSAFARAVAGERPMAVTAADGRAAVAIACAAYESAASRSFIVPA